MTRRLQRCLTCKPADAEGSKFARKRGFTRHKNRICAQCRRQGPPGYRVNYRGRAA